MSKNEVSSSETFELPISKHLIKWRELTMKDYDNLLQDQLVTTGKIYGFRKYLDMFIEKIEDKNEKLVAQGKDLKIYYSKMNPKDGLILLNKIDMIFNEIALIMKQTGLAEEKKALVMEFSDTAKEE